MPEDFHKK